MKYLKQIISTLAFMLIISCAEQDEFGSEIKIIIDIEYSTPNRQCREEYSPEECFNFLSQVTSEEKKLIAAAVGPLFVADLEAKVIQNVNRTKHELLNIETVLKNLKKQNSAADVNKIKLYEMLAQRRMDILKIELEAMLNGYQAAEKQISTISTSDFVPCSQIKMYDGQSSALSYYFCHDFVLLVHLNSLLLEYENNVLTAEELFPSHNLAKTIRARRDSIRSIIETRQNDLASFLSFVSRTLDSINEKTFINQQISNTPWIAIHTKPEFWLAQIKETGAKLSSVINESLEIRKQTIGMMTGKISFDEENTLYELSSMESNSGREYVREILAAKDLEINQTQHEIDELKKEIKSVKTRLSKDIKDVMPVVFSQDSIVRERLISVKSYEDLTYCSSNDDGATNSCLDLPDSSEEIRGSVIRLRGDNLDTSKLRIRVPDNVRILSNGIYHNVNDFQLKFDIYSAYFNCFTLDYLNLPPRNREHWRELCSRPHNVAGINLQNTWNHILGKGRINWDENGIVYDFDMEKGLKVNEELTAKWKKGNNDDRLIIIKEMIKNYYDLQVYYQALKQDFANSWAHRKSTLTGLEGYIISASSGVSTSISKSCFKSIGMCGFEKNIPVSVGYSDSVPKLTSISTSGKDLGFFHDATPSKNHVVGKLLGECLDADGQPLKDNKRFFVIGTSAFIDVPKNCYYMQLFINDDPKGVGAETCKPAIVNAIEVGSKHRHAFFNYNSSTAFINNREGKCTHLDHSNFLITVEFFGNTKNEMEKALEIVSEDNLLKLFGDSIAFDPNAVQITRYVIEQELGRLGLANDPQLVSFIMAYVDKWLSMKMMELKVKQLQEKLAGTSHEKQVLLYEQEKLESKSKLIEAVSGYIKEQSDLNFITLSYLQQLVVSYDLARNFYFSDILEKMQLYKDSIDYHRTKPSLYIEERYNALKSSIETVLDSGFFVSPIVLELGDGFNVDSWNKDYLIANLSNDLQFEDAKLELDKWISESQFVNDVLDSILYEKVNHCEIQVAKMPIQNYDENNPTGMQALLSQYYVPLISEINGDYIINNDFDSSKACALLDRTIFYQSCIDNIASFLSTFSLNKPSSDEDLVKLYQENRLMVQGYYDIEVGGALSEAGCIEPGKFNSPKILHAAAEAKTTDNSLNWPKFFPAQLSRFTSWSDGSGTYVNYIDYSSYSDLARKVLGEFDWQSAEKGFIKLLYSSELDECYSQGKISFAKQQSCFERLLGIQTNSRLDRRLGMFSNLRPDTRFHFVIPEVFDNNNINLLEQAKNWNKEFLGLRIHVFVKTNSY